MQLSKTEMTLFAANLAAAGHNVPIDVLMGAASKVDEELLELAPVNPSAELRYRRMAARWLKNDSRVTVYLKASSTGAEDFHPKWGALHLTQAMLATILRTRDQLAESGHISDTVFDSVDVTWNPDAPKMGLAEVQVTRSDLLVTSTTRGTNRETVTLQRLPFFQLESSLQAREEGKSLAFCDISK
ncbi:hypothetical protein KTD31_01795 [Burkholderia multivorans]|jgi:hypothetical protein|uniref:hypothetical protein n=1 Tax=Burkholderia multivorans TaxID=87883 RepID=UPI001C236F68|nr:hypothetical protein [Burkholderia multivorans]MBU9200136.1 hypothetical protein [Burkholderia multivorans]MDN8078742.1 hypothetical protein [Burkholderia multivorans]